MPPQKEVTIYDMARILGISPATVSRGLSGHPAISKKTKKKIGDLATEMGYRSNNFASNLRKQRTNTIGVIVPRLNSYFMSTVIAGIENVANEEGFSLLISQSSEEDKKEAASALTMFNSRVDGLLVSLAYTTKSFSHFDSFVRKNIPLMFFDRVTNEDNHISVLIDNRKAGHQATVHLIEQGCRNIVHITGNLNRNVYSDRMLGYRQALAGHGLDFNEDKVIVNDLSPESGAAAAQTILGMNPLPDGVFVANDNCAVGCMLTLKRAGLRIPHDIAFVGFNNDPVCNVVEPNLSTINYPGCKMGDASARNLIHHINGHTAAESVNTIILRSELVVRASSLKATEKIA